MSSVPTLLLLVTLAGAPRSAAPDSAAIAQLLATFLDGAGKPGAQVHERFWADDLVYTGSSGRRVSKADILRDVRSAPPPSPNDPVVSYDAEDVRIQQYGTTALLAFRLVANTDDHGRRETARYFNTGTFVKRGGEWRAVGWQATKIPFAEDEGTRLARSFTERFWRAMGAADTTSLAAMLDGGFVWTGAKGERLSRAELLADLASGRLKVESVPDGATPVVMRGETAVVGGTCRMRRAAASSKGVEAPATGSMTLVRDGGGWIALAMQSGVTP